MTLGTHCQQAWHTQTCSSQLPKWHHCRPSLHSSSKSEPNVFSPLYVMYRKPSSSLWSSYTVAIIAAAQKPRSPAALLYAPVQANCYKHAFMMGAFACTWHTAMGLTVFPGRHMQGRIMCHRELQTAVRSSSARTNRWQGVLHENKYRFLGWKSYPPSNDVYELSNAEVCWYKVPVQHAA